MIDTGYTLEQLYENGPFYLCRGGQPLACPHSQPEVQISELLQPDTNLLTPGQKAAPGQKTTNYARPCGTHCALCDVENNVLTVRVDQRCSAPLKEFIDLRADCIKPFQPETPNLTKA